MSKTPRFTRQSSGAHVASPSKEDSINNAIKKLTDSVNAMKESLTNVHTELKELRTELDTIKDLKQSLLFTENSLTDANEKITNLKTCMDKYQKENMDLSHRVALAETRNIEMKERLLQLDSYIRRENLKFTGIAEDQNESSRETERKIRNIFVKKLGINYGHEIEFQRCHRLGGKTGTKLQWQRDVIVRFLWFEDREAVWANKHKLKGSNIVIKEDFPKEIEERRSKLFPIFKAAKESNHKTRLIVDKLILDGQSYTVNTLNNLPPDLQSAHLSTKIMDKAVLFHGKNSFLSNFFPAPFILDGKTFSGAEQYYQYEKAVHAADNDTAAKILATEDPVEQMHLGKKVAVKEEHWNNNLSEQIMEVAVKTKFVQNPVLRKKLVDTGNKALIACNVHDKYWGVGMKLQDKSVCDKSKWKGQNVLGNILLRVRENLK